MIVTYEKLTRPEIIDALVERDGTRCQFPECDLELNFSSGEGPRQVTVDHWIPQHYGRSNGWSFEQIWALNNLKLMCKKCNAKKGDRIPNDDGALPERVVRKFRYRRDKRAGRAEFCVQCDNGHNLAPDEFCASCGCDAQRFPRWAKVGYNECDHEVVWCWVCSITPDMRPSSIGTAMRQSDSDELGEWRIEEI